MVKYPPVNEKVIYLLIEKIDAMVAEHNKLDPEAFMPKVSAEEYYRGTPEWSLALEWRTRQGVASFDLHANSERVCMTFVFLRESMAAKTWAETLHHRGKPHWNTVIDYIASLGDFILWNHQVRSLQQQVEQRQQTSQPAAGG